MSASPAPITAASAAAPSPERFKQALACFATGVTVITARADPSASVPNPQGFIGLTASSFNSVSLNPPLVLWSLGLGARSLPAFLAGSHYVVNVLAASQRELCERFAYAPGDRFAGIDWQPGACGLPILDGCLAWFECRHRSRYEEGDHIIFVGEVERCGTGAQQPPLIYQGSRFQTTQALDVAAGID